MHYFPHRHTVGLLFSFFRDQNSCLQGLPVDLSPSSSDGRCEGRCARIRVSEMQQRQKELKEEDDADGGLQNVTPSAL